MSRRPIVKTSFLPALWGSALLSLCAALATASNLVYEAPNAFVSRHFDATPPTPALLYPDAELRRQIELVLGHRYSQFRIRYWIKDGRSVWVLEEKGKERPITGGFVVLGGQLQEMKVLIFRESRGWEVKYDAFSRQFAGARLLPTLKLDRRIDNISGATLSVSAVTRLAKLALLLHQSVA